MSQQNTFLITVTMTRKLVHVALYNIVISGLFPFVRTDQSGWSVHKQNIPNQYVLSLSFKFLQNTANNFESDYLLRVWSTIPSK